MRDVDPADAQLHAVDLSRNGPPLMPRHPARARELLRKGRAAVVRHG
ncbi:RRXRR domain-containing protein [Streptomyces sp. NPDC007971]